MADGDRPWFYHPGSWVVGEPVALDPEEARHAQGSLRIRPGEAVVLADGCGGVAAAEVTRVDRRSFELRVVSIERFPPPAPPRLWLAPALIRGPRFDTLVEKATELGVSGIAPLITRHTEVRTPPGGEAPDRWRRLAVTALKQCRRPWLPEIRPPGTLEELLATAGSDLLLVAHPCSEGAPAPQDVAPKLFEVGDSREISGRYLLLIGPEGGWHAAELERLAAAGARRVHLGETRLRAETAALALICFARSGQGVFRAW